MLAGDRRQRLYGPASGGSLAQARRPLYRGPAEFIQASVLDRTAMRRAMDGVDSVFHLAAICHLWIKDPREYDRVNHIGTRVALEVAAERKVRRFIHGSTEAILLPRIERERTGGATAIDVNDMPGPYTRSKFLAEQAARDAARSGLPVSIVNPTAPIGPGDHSFTPPTRTLAYFMHHRPLFALNCILNFVDVRDVVRGFVAAEERGRIGERYVLGGQDITVRDLLARIDRLSGRRTFSIPLPGPVALGFAKTAEWFANHVTRRSPLATIEGVRLAFRSAPVDVCKAQAELGYVTRSIDVAIADAVAWLSARERAKSDAPATWKPGIPQPRF